MENNLVDRFCTPPVVPFTEFDKKALNNLEKFDIPFEGYSLRCYSIGAGKSILIVHGWGSRASHLLLLAKYLSNFGFRCVTFDAPAHFSYGNLPGKHTSNMFEFGRAISSVAGYLEDVYGIIGHSIGAAASSFAISGFLKFKEYKININKLILISSPSSVESIMKNYCSRHTLDENDSIRLRDELEKAFSFKVDDYQVGQALKNVDAEIMLVHDEDDDEISINDMRVIQSACQPVRIFVSQGYGHDKIIMNRKMFVEKKSFFAS